MEVQTGLAAIRIGPAEKIKLFTLLFTRKSFNTQDKNRE